MIFSHVLYQLSYPGIAVAEGRHGSSARWKRAYGEGTGPCPAPSCLNLDLGIAFGVHHRAGQSVAFLQPVDEVAVAAAR